MRRTILLSTATVLLFAGLVAAFYITFTSQVPGANDFYPRWRGAQLFWQDGVDPYSDTATAAIQQDMYGRLALPDEDQVLFVYPFYTVILLAPLVALPYAWVQAIWLVLLLFCLVGGVILWLRFLNWQPAPWLLGLTLLWAVIFYSSTRTIILGQFAGIVFLALVGCLVALKQDRDILAGFLLALSTFKPQMVFLIVPALLLWGLGQRRWRFISSAAVSMLFLFGLSFALQPNWLSSFVTQVFAYPGYTVLGNPLQIITLRYLPFLGAPVDYLLRGVLFLLMLWGWRQLPSSPLNSERFLFIFSLTLLVSNLVVPETATTNYVVLYLPLLWMLKTAVSKQSRLVGQLTIATFYLVSFVGFWLLFLWSIDGDAESSIMFLPLPLGLLLCLWLLRRQLLTPRSPSVATR